MEHRRARQKRYQATAGLPQSADPAAGGWRFGYGPGADIPAPSGYAGESCSFTSAFADDTSARRSGLVSKLSRAVEAGGHALMPLPREQVIANERSIL